MNAVLLIDGDQSTLDVFSAALRRRGFTVCSASDGARSLDLARSAHPDVVVTDVKLPDGAATDLLKRVRGKDTPIPLIVLTESFEQLLAAIAAAATKRTADPQGDDPLVPEAHAAGRWAAAVARAVDSPSDPRTLRLWGRHIGAAPGTLRNWCRTARLSPKKSLTFARVLRVVVLRQRDPQPLEDLFDVVDRRTLATLLKLGDKAAAGSLGIPPTIDDFLRAQRWIQDPRAIHEVRRALRTLLRLPAGNESTFDVAV